ncbi:MAG: B12-binding domain-containing radical SAM protein [Nanoarchaeota archaeon]|nr:B12-binding domain-containing radical SAM protein [Nanoarchaeota archaeon]
MNITLLVPPQSEGPSPNLGILHLAAMLEKEFSVKIVEQTMLLKTEQYFEPEKLLEEVEETSPKILGITTMCDNYHYVLGFAKIYKQQNPDTIIVLGGPHATLTAKITMENFSWIDIIVKHEGEETILELARKIRNNQSLEDVKGIVFRSGKEVIENSNRELIPNLDTLPFAAHHLIAPLKKYHDVKYKNGAHKFRLTAKMMAIRGCPFNCIYCSTNLMWLRKRRSRSVNHVIAEIKYLIETQGIQLVAFVDDIFTTNKKWVEEFCNEMKKVGIFWSCSSRVDTVDENLLQRMKESGCISIYYGVESGSPSSLKYMRKGGEKYPILTLDVVKKTLDLGIKVMASFMVGFPDETVEDLEKTYKIGEQLQEMGANVQGHMVAVYPGTDLLEKVSNTLEKTDVHSNAYHFGLSQRLEKYFCPDKEEWITKFPEIFSQFYAFETRLDRRTIKDYELKLMMLQKKLSRDKRYVQKKVEMKSDNTGPSISFGYTIN